MKSSHFNLFQLPESEIYLNCAYMSPMLKSAEIAGLEALARKRTPWIIGPDDYFETADKIRLELSKIIQASPAQIALVPSASYGLQSAVSNIDPASGSHALVIKDEFPSGYYTAARWTQKHKKKLIQIAPTEHSFYKGQNWNEQILNAIQNDTAFLLMSSVHWMDGTRFDLEAIGKRCRETNTTFIVDGTQSVGAIPINVQEYKIDALVCSGYKWLMGPYTSGFAYFNEKFNTGTPIEESWVTRSNAKRFSELTQYVNDYAEGAFRFNMGEMSNFILLPVWLEGLKQINQWGVENISNYCTDISMHFISTMKNTAFKMEEDQWRSSHLFGIYLPETMKPENVIDALKSNHIHVSLRGKSIRVSPHMYNSESDFQKLLKVLQVMP